MGYVEVEIDSLKDNEYTPLSLDLSKEKKKKKYRGTLHLNLKVWRYTNIIKVT